MAVFVLFAIKNCFYKLFCVCLSEANGNRACLSQTKAVHVDKWPCILNAPLGLMVRGRVRGVRSPWIAGDATKGLRDGAIIVH